MTGSVTQPLHIFADFFPLQRGTFGGHSRGTQMSFRTEPVPRRSSTLYSSPNLFVVKLQTLFLLSKHSPQLLRWCGLMLLHSSSSRYYSKLEVLLEVKSNGREIFFKIFQSYPWVGYNIVTAYFWIEDGMIKKLCSNCSSSANWSYGTPHEAIGIGWWWDRNTAEVGVLRVWTTWLCNWLVSESLLSFHLMTEHCQAHQIQGFVNKIIPILWWAVQFTCLLEHMTRGSAF